MESVRKANTKLLKTLIRAKQESGLALKEFVDSYQWALATEGQGDALNTFSQSHDYNDTYLIDAQGNILFSVAKEDDLGTNIFNGEYSASRFGVTAKASLTTGKTLYTGLERHSPSGGAISGFFISVLLDETYNKVGLIAIQIVNTQIENILRDHGGSISNG